MCQKSLKLVTFSKLFDIIHQCNGVRQGYLIMHVLLSQNPRLCTANVHIRSAYTVS